MKPIPDRKEMMLAGQIIRRFIRFYARWLPRTAGWSKTIGFCCGAWVDPYLTSKITGKDEAGTKVLGRKSHKTFIALNQGEPSNLWHAIFNPQDGFLIQILNKQWHLKYNYYIGCWRITGINTQSQQPMPTGKSLETKKAARTGRSQHLRPPFDALHLIWRSQKSDAH